MFKKDGIMRRAASTCSTIIAVLLALGAGISTVQATELAVWTFEVSVPTTAGPHAAEGGLNAGAGSPATGFHASGAVAYSNPVGNGSGESFSSNNWATGDYYEFATSTLGQMGITISWCQTRSGTGPASFDLEYSLDGETFTTLVNDYEVPQITWSSGSNDPNSCYGPISAPAALNNQAVVYFRLTSQVTSAATGTNRVDDIVISADGVDTGPCCFDNGSCTLLEEGDCDTAGGTWQGSGGSCSPNPCPQSTGACCDPNTGNCTIELEVDCVNLGFVWKGANTDCTINPCIGACCDQGGSTCTIRTPLDCAQQPGSGIYRGDGTQCDPGTCPVDYDGILINEIRIDQPGADIDEYFEIVNTSGSTKSLDGLTYIVIGDTGTDSSGIIESITDLSGFSIPAGGHFLAARSTLTLQGAVPDLIANFNFENSDNVTHMLVSGFFGVLNEDVDTNNDCSIDNPRWVTVLDRVALIEASNLPGGPPVGTGCHYGTGDPFIDTFQDGPFVPGHVFRFPDGSNFGFEDWQVGQFDPLVGDDTPGAPNALATGACCAGAFCLDDVERQVCVESFGGIWLGRDSTCELNGSECTGACCICTDPPACTTFDCQILDPDTCGVQAPSGGVFQGPGTTCPPTVGGVDCAECKTIDEARMLAPGTGVRICNVVLSSKTNLINSAANKSFQIQDTTGLDGQSALTVFGTTDLIDSEFGGAVEGDQIDIQGTIGVFNGLIQLQNATAKALALSRIDGAVGVPAPVVVSGADFQDGNPDAENFESEIVRLECVTFQQTGNFAAATNYTVSDGMNIVVVRVSTAFQVDIVNQPIPTGPVSITGIFSQFDPNDPRDGNYQLQLRTISDIDTSPSCGPTAACCLGGGLCRDDLPEALCDGVGGIFNPGQPTCPPTPPCPDNLDTRITEIRIDQPGDDLDEYFELSGTAGTPIGDLTYIVLGDGPDLNSGIVEVIVPLANRKIPGDGYFLCAESTFTIRPLENVDLITNLNFENDDNVTHMLVKNFTGTQGQDLDTDDDGVLDIEPWDLVLDRVALIRQQNPPTTTEWHYGPPVVGPSGGTSPGHVALCPSMPPEWRVEAFDPATGDDTPGEANPPICSCAGCLGDLNVDGLIDARDIQVFVDILVSMSGDGCADINQDGAVDYDDVGPFADRVLEGPLCGLNRSFGLRLVTWNLLNYGGAAPSNRKTAYKRVLNHLNADIVVVQEIAGLTGANDFLTTVLNASDGPGGYTMADFTDGPNSDNALYYRADAVSYTMGDHITLGTTPRISDRWKLSYIGNPPDSEFYVYGMHLRAGSAMEDPQNPIDRAAAAAVVRADANNLPLGAQFIYAGDFNLYNSAEGAWTEFTGSQMNDNGRSYDPINAVGSWSGNCSFSAYHTQSTHQDNVGAPPGAANGGLDDRFDFMLISDSLRDSVGLTYMNGSYRAFGNDGNHCNADINDPPIIPQGLFIADALHAATDHLPVVMELLLITPP